MSAPLPVLESRTAHDSPQSDHLSVPILVVDDDAMKRFALKRLLAPLGYSIVEADSGRAALRHVLAQDFALILLDVRMPGMDGFETAALLHTRQRSKLTPILLTTASTRAEVIASGLYGDMVKDFVLAPVESVELRCLVKMFGDLHLKAMELAGQAEEQRAGAHYWQTLTEAAPVGIFRTDQQHRYTYLSPRWSEITGISSEAALGQEWSVIADAGQAARPHAESATEVLPGRLVSHRIQIRVAGQDPRSVFLSENCVPPKDDGTGGWVGALTDLTDLTGVQSGTGTLATICAASALDGESDSTEMLLES